MPHPVVNETIPPLTHTSMNDQSNQALTVPVPVVLQTDSRSQDSEQAESQNTPDSDPQTSFREEDLINRSDSDDERKRFPKPSPFIRTRAYNLRSREA